MEIQELFEGIGYKPEDPEKVTRQDVVDFLNENFVKRTEARNDPDLIKSIKGSAAAELFKELKGKVGEDFVDFKDLNIKDALGAVVEKYNASLEDVRKSSKEGQSKQVLDLQAKLEDLTRSLGDFKGANEELKNKNSELEKGFEAKIREFKISSKRKDIETGIPWSDSLTDVQRAGLKSVLNENYVFDLEGDDFVVKSKDGHKIKNEKKAGEFYTPAEVYEQVAEANGLLKKNNGGAQETKRFQFEKGGGEEKGGFKPKERKVGAQ
jgi:hypothetical protein